jgi:hypothetical protein
LYDLVILAPAYVAVFTREGGRAAIRWTGAGVALAPLLLPLAATSQIPVITPFLALWFAAWTGSRRNGSAVTAAQTPPGPPT